MGRYQIERVLMISLGRWKTENKKIRMVVLTHVYLSAEKPDSDFLKMKKYFFSFINADDIIISFKKNPMVIEQSL